MAKSDLGSELEQDSPFSKEGISQNRKGPRKTFIHRSLIFGVSLFLLALLLRLVGIGWGLPNEGHHWSYHPDEPDIWIYSQSVKPAEGKFTPGFYNYGTFYLTLLSVSTDVVNGYGGGPKEKDGSDAYLARGRYHLAGRVISALAGAGLAWVVFLMLWRRTHPFGALFGGLAMVFAPGLVIHSRFQTVDVLATFLLTLGLYYSLRISDSPLPSEGDGLGERAIQPRFWTSGVRLAAISGLFFGLSAGTKYTGLLGLLALVVFCAYQKKWKELAIGITTCLLTFVVTTPGILLDSERFWHDFAYEMAHTSQGHGLVFAGTSPGFIYHLVNLAVGFGPILLLLGVVGLGRAAFKKYPWAVALLVFGVAYYLLIGRAEVKFLRYTFPLIPVLACGGGWLFGRAHTHPNKRWRAVGAIGVLGLGGFLVGGGASTAIQATSLMQSPEIDPRQSILGLVKDDPGTIGLVSDPWFYSPNFYPEAGSPRRIPFARRNAEMLAATGSSTSPIVRFVPENPDERYDWDVRLLDLKPKYVVFSSFETEGVDRLALNSSVQPEVQVFIDRYKAFAKRLQLEYDHINPLPKNQWEVVHDLMYIRPTIWVWKRKIDSPRPSSGSSTTSGMKEAPASTR